MSDNRYSRGGKNPHMRNTEKKPCEVCGEMAKHYPTGEIEKHKKYFYEKVRGVMKKTTKSTYCTNKRWFD